MADSLWFLLDVGRRVVEKSQVIIWATPRRVSQNVKRDWQWDRIFYWNVISREVGRCGDCRKWSENVEHLSCFTGSLHDMKKGA